MLTEWNVVTAVCAELRSRDYQIDEARKPTQHGDDIVALKRSQTPFRLSIEAKGQTSSRKGSRRHGQPFNSAQIRVHVARAFYKAAEVISRKGDGTKARAGIALPDTPKHRTTVQAIKPVLDQLEIAVFWVQSDQSVQVVSLWEV